jgi:hypothetical protein
MNYGLSIMNYEWKCGKMVWPGFVEIKAQFIILIAVVIITDGEHFHP